MLGAEDVQFLLRPCWELTRCHSANGYKAASDREAVNPGSKDEGTQEEWRDILFEVTVGSHPQVVNVLNGLPSCEDGCLPDPITVIKYPYKRNLRKGRFILVFSSKELSSIVMEKVQPQPGEVWRQRLEASWSHCIYSQEAEDK